MSTAYRLLPAWLFLHLLVNCRGFPVTGPVSSSAASAADRSDDPGAGHPAALLGSMAGTGVSDHPLTATNEPDTLGSETEPLLILPTVIVTAMRLRIPLAENPAATTVVTGALRDMPRTIAADEALSLVPGVLVDNQAGGERVHISSRGIGILTERGVRGIKVLLDGLPLNDPSGFAPDLFDVDWATVGSIEVFRGPASALYGGGSAGGIIDIATYDGGPVPIGGRAAATVGSYGFWKALGQVDGVSDGRSYRTTASRMMGDGYRQHTKYHATNIYTKLGWNLGARGRLTAIVAGTSFFNENAEGLNLDWLAQDRRMANPDALTYNEYQRTRRATVGLVGQIPIGGETGGFGASDGGKSGAGSRDGLDSNIGGSELSFRLYGRQARFDESVPSTVLHRLIGTPGGGIQYTISVRTGPLAHRLAVGADLDGQIVDEYRRPNLGGAQEDAEVVSDQTIHQRSEGAFLVDRVLLGGGWSLMVGARRDRIRNELTDHLRAGGIDLSGLARFHKTTARCGAAWNPRAQLGIYASWGQGFLPPATEELANNPERLGGFNANLVPATSSGGEIGMRGTFPTFGYDVTAFHLRTDNDFGRFRVPERPLETFYENTGRSRRTGLESLLTWLPLPDVTLQLAYTWSRFRYDHADYNGVTYRDTWVPNSPQHRAMLDAEYRFGRRFAIGASGELRGHWYVDASNVASVDGYTLLHARVSVRWQVKGRTWEVKLAGHNLTGEKYIAFTEPDPDGNSYQPAPTRELLGSLSTRF